MEIYGDVNIFGDNSQIHVNYDLNSSKRYNGFITYDRVVSGVEYGDLLYLNIKFNVWEKACADDEKTLPARGIACGDTLTIDGEIPILLNGFMYLDTYSSIIKSEQLWVSDMHPGKIIDTMPSRIGRFIQAIGFARNPNIFYFDFCPFYVQIG